jgi:hypothetical protein
MDNAVQEIPVIEVRVLDCNKKSKYVTRKSSNFPIVTTLDQFRENILRLFPDLKPLCLTNFQFGYVAERNKKYVVKNADELEKGFDNAVSGYPFWIDPFCEDSQDTIAVGKRK